MMDQAAIFYAAPLGYDHLFRKCVATRTHKGCGAEEQRAFVPSFRPYGRPDYYPPDDSAVSQFVGMERTTAYIPRTAYVMLSIAASAGAVVNNNMGPLTYHDKEWGGYGPSVFREYLGRIEKSFDKYWQQGPASAELIAICENLEWSASHGIHPLSVVCTPGVAQAFNNMLNQNQLTLELPNWAVKIRDYPLPPSHPFLRADPSVDPDFYNPAKLASSYKDSISVKDERRQFVDFFKKAIKFEGPTLTLIQKQYLQS